MKIMGVDKRNLKKDILKSIKIHIKNWKELGLDYDSVPPLILAIKERAFIYTTLENFTNYRKDIDDYEPYLYIKYEYQSFITILSWENDYKELSKYYTSISKKPYPFKGWSVKDLKKICRRF